MNLVKRFPLLKIRDKTHLRQSFEVIDELLILYRKEELTEDEEDYLSALSELVHSYEQEHFPMERIPPVEILKYLMEVNDLKQADLAHLFSSKSNLSEILSGRRQISKAQAKRLSEHFKMNPGAFIG